MAGRQAKKKKKTSSGKTVLNRRKISKFELSTEERLELENLQLKEGSLRERLAAISTQQQKWGKAVMAKYKVKLQDFVINVDTGECKRRELRPVPEGGGE